VTLPVWDHLQGDPLQHLVLHLTDVIPGATRHEQRRKLRRAPRHRVRSAFLVEGRRRQQLELKLARHAGSEWELPLWMFGQSLGSVSAAATTITCTTADRGFVDGGRALLGYPDSDVREIVTIATVEATHLALADPTAAVWPAGTMLYPLRRARLVDAPALPRFTGDAVKSEVEFELVEPLDWRAYTWPTSYRSLPVFELSANWAQEPSQGLPRGLLVTDVQTGVQDVVDLPDAPLATLEIGVTLVGTDEIGDAYAMLFDLAGKRSSIWVHSHAKDLTPVAIAGAASTTLDVEAIGLADATLPVTRRDVRIATPDGTVTLRRITAVTVPSAGVERLQLDGAIGGDVAPGDATQVSWLWLARQAADVDTLSYWRGDVVDVPFSFEGFNHDL
jgi:hypothetical protein